MKTRTPSRVKVNLSELSRQVQQADRKVVLAKGRVRRVKSRLRRLKKTLKQTRKAAKQARRAARDAHKLWEQASGEALAITQVESVRKRKAKAATKAKRRPDVVKPPRRGRRQSHAIPAAAVAGFDPRDAAPRDLAELPPAPERRPEAAAE